MNRTTQIQKAEAFAKLHKPGEPVVLVNIWDSASAAAVAKAGAKALARAISLPRGDVGPRRACRALLHDGVFDRPGPL